MKKLFAINGSPRRNENTAQLLKAAMHGTSGSILTGDGIPSNIGLVSVPIRGMSQRRFIVTKKGRQIYASERCLMDFVRYKFAVPHFRN